MGPMTISALIAGTVALSSDVMVSACTYTFMNSKDKQIYKTPKDPLKDLLRRRGSYAQLHNSD